MPQCLGDSFWFFYCKNMPDELPEYISELPSDILEMFFTKEEVERIEGGAPFKLPKPVEWILHEEVNV